MQQALLSVVVVGCLLSGQGAGDARKQAREKLQGNWKATEVISGGKKAAVEVRMAFQGDKVAMVVQDGGGFSGTFSVDPEKAPATLDVTHGPEGSKVTVLAIYELKGDTLRLAVGFFADKRPKSFSDDKTIVYNFKKKKS